MIYPASACSTLAVITWPEVRKRSRNPQPWPTCQDQRMQTCIAEGLNPGRDKELGASVNQTVTNKKGVTSIDCRGGQRKITRASNPLKGRPRKFIK